MRGKIILICRKVASYDFTLHDFVTVYFQNENCWWIYGNHFRLDIVVRLDAHRSESRYWTTCMLQQSLSQRFPRFKPCFAWEAFRFRVLGMARYSRNDQAGVELPKAKLDRESVREALELFSYLRPYRVRFAFALVVLFLTSLLSLCFPYLAGSLIDAAVTGARAGGAMGDVDRTALLLLAVLAVQSAFAFFHTLSAPGWYGLDRADIPQADRSSSHSGREPLSPIRLIVCRDLGSLQDPSTKTANRWCRPGGPQPTGYGL